jgi:hypothetical protein
MNFQHVNVKMFVEGELSVGPEQFIKVFHRWVAEQSLDEMLIDVADYSHVPSGPGVLLVGLEADYSLDHTGGRSGLRYNRKAPLEGSNQDRFRQAFAAASAACRRLETEFSGLKFSRREFDVFINDRALAPNTPETFAAFQPELEAFLRGMLGAQEFTFSPPGDRRRLLGATVKLDSPIELPERVASS